MDRKQKAALFMVLSALSLSMMQIVVKQSGKGIPMQEQVFARNAVTLVIGLAMLVRKKEFLFGKKEHQAALLLRSVLGYLGVAAYFYATKHMLAADASILHRSSPFFVTIFAFLFLKEKLTKIHIGVLVTALAGAVLVIKPQLSSEAFPALIGLSSAMFAGGAYTVISYLKGKESNAVIIFYFSFVSCILSVLFGWKTFIMPDAYGLFMLLLIGVLAGLGQVFLTVSYKNAAPGEVSIYNYSGIIFSCLLGTVCLGEVIDGRSILGILLIIGAGAVLFFKKKRLVS